MNEGTKSYLIGCHQFLLHPLWVLLAWRLHFKHWPKWWQIICIFLHDIGICGRQYLSDPEAKKGHWICGALLSGYIVAHIQEIRRLIVKRHLCEPWVMDDLAIRFCAGHSPSESGYPRSDLFWADKRSWLVAPMWWLWLNYWIEWSGKGIGVTPPPKWKAAVRRNLAARDPLCSHELYLRTCAK